MMAIGGPGSAQFTLILQRNSVLSSEVCTFSFWILLGPQSARSQFSIEIFLMIVMPNLFTLFRVGFRPLLRSVFELFFMSLIVSMKSRFLFFAVSLGKSSLPFSCFYVKRLAILHAASLLEPEHAALGDHDTALTEQGFLCIPMSANAHVVHASININQPFPPYLSHVTSGIRRARQNACAISGDHRVFLALSSCAVACRRISSHVPPHFDEDVYPTASYKDVYDDLWRNTKHICQSHGL